MRLLRLTLLRYTPFNFQGSGGRDKRLVAIDAPDSIEEIQLDRSSAEQGPGFVRFMAFGL